MGHRTVRAFVFDLDGTLIDSREDLANSVNAMLGTLNRPELPLETVSGFVGHGAPQLMASVLGVAPQSPLAKQALEVFLAHYAKHNLDATRAYPGVAQTLAQLDGSPLAVLTNKPMQMTLDILDGLNLRRYFAAIYGGDSFPTKKPHPEGLHQILRELETSAAETAMVGDSEVDVQTARNAGAMAINVNFGFGAHDRVAHPADVYLDSFAELLRYKAG